MWQRRRFLSSGLGWWQFRMAKLSHLLMFIVWLGLKEFNVTGLYFWAGFLGGTRQICSPSEKYLQHICRHWGLKNRLWDWRNKSPICSVKVGPLPTWVVSQRSNGWCPQPYTALPHTAGGVRSIREDWREVTFYLSHISWKITCLMSSSLNCAFSPFV